MVHVMLPVRKASSIDFSYITVYTHVISAIRAGDIQCHGRHKLIWVLVEKKPCCRVKRTAGPFGKQVVE